MPLPVDCSSLGLPLRTSRLEMRALREEDFNDLLVLCTHAEICRYIRPPMSREQVRDHIAARLRPWFFEEAKWYSLAVCVIGKKRVIGELVFRLESKTDRRAEIGFRFHPDGQGRGYAFEATAALMELLFNKLDLHKLTAYCYTENEASKRLLTRLGMLSEGLQRDHLFVNGQWHHINLYGLLRHETRTTRR